MWLVVNGIWDDKRDEMETEGVRNENIRLDSKRDCKKKINEGKAGEWAIEWWKLANVSSRSSTDTDIWVMNGRDWNASAWNPS